MFYVSLRCFPYEPQAVLVVEVEERLPFLYAFPFHARPAYFVQALHARYICRHFSAHYAQMGLIWGGVFGFSRFPLKFYLW